MTSIEHYAANQLLHLSMTSLTCNECHSWVYEPCQSKIGSSKEIVGVCKYYIMCVFGVLLWVELAIEILRYSGHIVIVCWYKYLPIPPLYLYSIQYKVYKWVALWQNLLMTYTNIKDADQHAQPRSLITAFVVHCLDSIIPILAKSKISWL